MAWTDGLDRAVNYIITATNWNDLLGAAGSLMQLKSHAHGGTTGEGAQAIGPLTTEDFTDAAAPAAPTAGRTRLYTVSGQPRYRANGGADRQIITDQSTAAGDLAGTYPSPTVAKITLGADADGDIYYRASSVLARLPKGAALAGLRMNSGATAPEWALGGITIATEQATTSGTSKDFTGIPSGAKRITIMLVGVSTNGTSPLRVQLGDSGGVETSGYLGATAEGASASALGAGFDLSISNAAAQLANGSVILTLEDSSDNTWTCLAIIGSSTGALPTMVAGSKATSAVLDRVRLTTVNGTDTFDAGAMSISYE